MAISVKDTVLDLPTTDCTLSCQLLAVVAVAVGQSQIALNQRTLAEIDCEQNPENMDPGTKRIECRYYLIGEISILLGTGL